MKARARGAEVVQLYVGDCESSVPRPPKELKAFRKVRLRAGEARRIDFALDARDFAFYSEAKRSWMAETGDFTLQIGSSSRDIRVSRTIQLLKDHQFPIG